MRSIHTAATQSATGGRSGQITLANFDPIGLVAGGRRARRVDIQTSIEPWREHLEKEAGRVARKFKEKLSEVHTQEREKLEKTRVQCAHCSERKLKEDIVSFHCSQRASMARGWKSGEAEAASATFTTVHRFCNTCVLKLLTEQMQTRSRLECSSSRHLLEDLHVSCGGQFAFVVCPLCRTPNVVTQQATFIESFAREKMDSRLQFTVHIGATKLLTENFFVEEVYENQRRPMFGAFSAENLFVLDFRGKFSTRDASEVEDMERTFEKPNLSWGWADEWSPDTRIAGMGGWLYATRWEDDDSKWHPGPPRFVSFVRKRRLLRTRIRFSAEVKAALVAIYVAKEDDVLGP